MRIRIVSFTLCAALVLGISRVGVAQGKAAERPADAAAIRAHIESIFQAFVDKDRKKLEEKHGVDWRGVNASEGCGVWCARAGLRPHPNPPRGSQGARGA